MKYQIKDTNYYPIHEVHIAGCKDLSRDKLQLSKIIDAENPQQVAKNDMQDEETLEDYKIMNCTKI